MKLPRLYVIEDDLAEDPVEDWLSPDMAELDILLAKYAELARRFPPED